MRKQKIQKAMVFVSIVFALVLLFSSLHIINEEKVIEDIIVEDIETNAYTTSSVFEEFVKSDGTTYIRSKADGIKKNNIEE